MGIGYRKESEVYDEIRFRIKTAGRSPATTALTEVLKLFDKPARGLEPTPEPSGPEPTPKWLVDSLTLVAGIEPAAVAAMSTAEAEAAWQDFITSPKHVPLADPEACS